MAGGLAGAVVVLAPTAVTLLLAAAAAYFLLVMLVATAGDPRRAADVSMALLATTLSWSGITAGAGLSVAEVAPLAFFPLAVAGATDHLGYRSRRQTAALATPVLMTVGGLLAATVPGTTIGPVVVFAVAAITLMTSVYVLRPDRREVNVILAGLVAGVVLSTVLGLAFLREPSGRTLGLTEHPNQYAMAVVLAVPLLWHLVRDQVLPAALGLVLVLVLVLGVMESGSRSGLLALAGVLVVWLYRERGVYVTFGALMAAGLGTAALVALVGVSEVPALQRLLDPSATADSDAGRVALLTRELTLLFDGNYIVGTGFSDDRLPHNIVLVVWGGFGLLGLAFFWLLWHLLRPAFSRRADELSAALALGSLGFIAAVSLNNVIGASFFWLTAALTVFWRHGPLVSSPTSVGGTSTTPAVGAAHREVEPPGRRPIPASVSNATRTFRHRRV